MKDIIVSPQLAISTPFVMNNDGVRCQMAASQCRQAVPLEDNEPPIVETTLERSRILEPDIIRAKYDCEVIFSSTRLIITKRLESGKYDIHRISYYYKIPKEGSVFKKGDVISYKIGYFDDKGNLAQGKNLTCAILIHPWGYQDSIVLGDHVSLTSYHYHVIEKMIPQSSILLSLEKEGQYKILPEVGEKIEAFQPFLLIKKNDPTRILDDPEQVYINEDSEVVEVELVGNRWNTDIREYDIAILEILQRKQKLLDKLKQIIDDEYVLNEIKRYHYLYEYSSLLQNQVKNIKYGKNDFDLYVRIVLRSKRPIEEGDKLSNRHANKGVISKITTMPTLKDGRKIDIIIDIMSIPSRMNLGQVYEVIGGNCILYLQKKLQEFEDINTAKEFVIGFYDIIDNTEEKWILSYVKEFLKDINDLEELKNIQFTFPVPPFESTTRNQIIEACCYLNPSIKQNLTKYFDENLEQLPDLSPLLEIADLGNGKQIYVTSGPMYFYKLVHMAREKLSARGVGKIMKKTMQPTGGRKNQGGQRFGEMEVWCLLAYGALFNLHEIIRLKSDDIQQKIMYMLKNIYGSDLSILKEEELEVVKLFKAYLRVLRTRLEE